jgi:DNA helicase-2/ATP-dependent DNA helicase PcrA
MRQLLNNLNENQRLAVTTTEGPVVVVAGAGSGKTRVITCRVAYLIGAIGLPPRNILAVTFTNKAAQEMRGRIHRLLGVKELESWIGTFHATCAQILRREAGRIGYKSNFAIYDESDQLTLIKHCMKKLSLHERDYNPRALLSRISLAKGALLAPADFESRVADYFEEKVAKAYKLYQRLLRENNAMDFDDLLNNALKVLVDFPDCLQKYRSYFRHILVDEFQDTNHAQYELVRLLARESRNLCVVGDDDQSIYSWRGADVGNLLDLQVDFPEAKTVFLEENYRSTQLILDAANTVIENNSRRKPKSLWTQRKGGEKIQWYCARDEHAEARYIIERISELSAQSDELDASDFAVFYRTNAQSRVIEDELRIAGLPYTIVGGLKFYDRKEVKDVLAYLKVIANSRDSVSLRRIINTPPRGIGAVTLERAEGFADEQGVSLFEALGRASKISELRPRARENLMMFHEYVRRLIERRDDASAAELIREVIETSGYAEMLRQDPTFQAESRIENLDELISAAVEMGESIGDFSLDAFLQKASLQAGIDEWNGSTEFVTLMTLHTAKGLEFPAVFMAGMEEGLFPHLNSLANAQGLEEERRLCYVGITRARSRLFFTSADIRRVRGITSANAPSRFINEIPSELIDSIRPFAGVAGGDFEEYCQEMPDYEEEVFSVGDIVRHEAFGSGEISAVNGSGERMKVAVRFFRDNKRRDLVVKFAGLQRK